MLTPQELQNKKFEKAVFGGYDMSQVDDFLDGIIGDYTSLYKESITLKGKMKVLVDKVEEYRSVDDEIRKMLYTAQTKSKEMVANAEKEAQSIINSARATAEASIFDMRSAYDDEKAKLEAMKAETSKYASQMKEILNKNIEILDVYIKSPPKKEPIPHKGDEFKKVSPDTFEFELPKDFIVDRDEADTKESDSRPAEPEASPAVEHVQKTAHSLSEEDMATKFFEVQLGNKEQNAHKKSVEDEEESDTGKIYKTNGFTPKPRFQFDDLQFGANYDDEQDEKAVIKKK